MNGHRRLPVWEHAKAIVKPDVHAVDEDHVRRMEALRRAITRDIFGIIRQERR